MTVLVYSLCYMVVVVMAKCASVGDGKNVHWLNSFPCFGGFRSDLWCVFQPCLLHNRVLTFISYFFLMCKREWKVG